MDLTLRQERAPEVRFDIRSIDAALELLGRRWALRILWELRDGDGVGFRELRERCDAMSSSVLRDRLVELVDARILEQEADGGYRLARLGDGLVTALAPLDAWSKRWERAIASTPRPRPRRGPGSR